MEWGMIIAIISVNITLAAFFAGFMFWGISKIDGDVKGLGDRIDKIAIRLDGHASRIDQLYKMFVDLLKERKG